ncbi:MAG: hypothetical protein NT149_03775 [Candidatus Gottesmanbacteria bacterium]|nr:hypothetical protein [Candidatus Gottesmanbacteria bacterium]
MTKITVKKLVWDSANISHIRKHWVTKEEVAIAVERLGYHKHTYNKRYLLVGRSGKRIISVVIKRQARTVYYVVTARDADKKERRRLYEKENA